MSADKRNAILQLNRLTRVVLSAMNNIPAEEPVRRDDLLLPVEKVAGYEGRMDVRLKDEVRKLLCSAAKSSSGDLG